MNDFWIEMVDIYIYDDIWPIDEFWEASFWVLDLNILNSSELDLP